MHPSYLKAKWPRPIIALAIVSNWTIELILVATVTYVAKSAPNLWSKNMYYVQGELHLSFRLSMQTTI